MHIQSKLPDIGLSIFTVMSTLATDHNALNLSQGFPDFDVHPSLIEKVNSCMKAGHNQYAPMQGLLELREQISRKVMTIYDAQYDPNTEITVTAGATEALFAAISAVVRPGDEVIIFEPAYDAYMPVVLLNGGIPVFLKLKHPDYHVDWDEVKDTVSEKTRLIILNSPHNPTGAILSKTDTDALNEITRNTQILILSDEVYEHIVFDGQDHESLCKNPELAERSFVVSSFGKTYHTTGWKLGYCLAPAQLSREFQRIHQYVTFAVNTPIQKAYAKIMTDAALYLDLAGFYQQKRDLFLALMAPSRFSPLPCNGTYFQMLGYEKISGENDVDFARRLTTTYGVAAIPPSVFYNDKTDHKALRFCFAKKNETLEQAAEILCRI